jgi:DNA-directed RNA polymerase subunit RPC12/RpoP
MTGRRSGGKLTSWAAGSGNRTVQFVRTRLGPLFIILLTPPAAIIFWIVCTFAPFHCGACGAEVHTLSGARNVICESCGHIIDIEGGAVPCINCGAQLAFPVSINHMLCPYCNTDTKRV